MYFAAPAGRDWTGASQERPRAMGNTAELDRILAEQRRCRDLLLVGHPEQDGLKGAIFDWVAEEVLAMGENVRMENTEYEEFLHEKTSSTPPDSKIPAVMPSEAMPFQRFLIEWAVRSGRCAVFADCGMGKTLIQLAWAESVAAASDGRVLILTPLGVSHQTVGEAKKFGLQAVRTKDGSSHRITVTNYESLHLFSPSDFQGVVCDESSILKSFEGARRTEITAFMRKVPYRLLCTATAAPNDYTELGTSSEALGYLGHVDMLNRFFKNDMNNSAQGRAYGEVIRWRFKGHAEQPFWRWVCSWARAARKPSDLGFANDGFLLPPLKEVEHIVPVTQKAEGMLFEMPAIGMQEQREERRRSLEDRCRVAADLVNQTQRPAVVWCDLNDEGDLLEKLIPDSVQVSGKDSDDQKEEKLVGFCSGSYRVLVTKKRIGAWGLNMQHCAHEVYFPDHSFEQYYQCVRRCWRFGQRNPVTVDVVTTEGQKAIMANLKRKEEAAEKMFNSLVQHMRNELSISRAVGATAAQEVPSWL